MANYGSAGPVKKKSGWDAWNAKVKAERENAKAGTKATTTKKQTTTTASRTYGDVTRNLVERQVDRAVTKTVNKEVKKTTNAVKKDKKFVIALVACLLVGIIAGLGTFWGVCRKDCFEINGLSGAEMEIVIGVNEELHEYVEEGAKCVAFGKDISKSVKISYEYREDMSKDATSVPEIDENTPGYYYAIYEVDNIKYGSTKLIKLVVVLNNDYVAEENIVGGEA